MKNINLKPIIMCLPENIARAAERFQPEEIRFISGQAVMLFIGGEGFYITESGDISTSVSVGICADYGLINNIFCRFCDNSIYAVEDEIKEGFVTVEGGHRIGICGTAVMKNGELSTIKNISALNIRIARQIIGAANKIFPAIFDKYIRNTLIVSPPGCGKTTILRDLARILGEKYKVGIADERSELAAVLRGASQNNVGIRTVVMDACPKAMAINLMVRTMGIEVIITDEIGTADDEKAVLKALHLGVRVIASAHGRCFNDVKNLADCGFERIIFLSNRHGIGTIEEVLEC